MTLERTRADARELLRGHLGIAVPSIAALLDAATAALGAARMDRCVALARRVTLSRRRAQLCAIAGLTVGAKMLPPEWWQRPHARHDPPLPPENGPCPEEVLAMDALPKRPDDYTFRATPLETLDAWAADDVADQLWGASVAWIDANSEDSSDRIPLPRGAREGDLLMVSFDPGQRVGARVVRRSDGNLGSELDLRWRWCPVVEAGWGCHFALPEVRLLLPGDAAGTLSDPYGARMDASVLEVLRAWARAHDADGVAFAEEWSTKGHVVDAIAAADLGSRVGWYEWERAARALIDDDASGLAAAMARLGF